MVDDGQNNQTIESRDSMGILRVVSSQENEPEAGCGCALCLNISSLVYKKTANLEVYQST
jgi:hypothetical protein